MFSGVLRSILSGRREIIVSMVVKLVSPLSCFSLFEFVFVLVLFHGVRMLEILFDLFSFCFILLVCLSPRCGVVFFVFVFSCCFVGCLFWVCCFWFLILLFFLLLLLLLFFWCFGCSYVCECVMLLCLALRL